MSFLDTAKRNACNRCRPLIDAARKRLEYLEQVAAVSPGLKGAVEQLRTRLDYVDTLTTTLIQVDEMSKRDGG